MSNPYVSTAEDDLPEQPEYTFRKRRILILLLVYMGFLGAVTAIEDEESADRLADLVIGLPVLIFTIWWCRTDAEERDYRIGVLTNVCLVLFLAFGVPLYLFQTRGLRGIVSIGWLCLYVLAIIAAFVAGAMVVLGKELFVS